MCRETFNIWFIQQSRISARKRFGMVSDSQWVHINLSSFNCWGYLVFVFEGWRSNTTLQAFRYKIWNSRNVWANVFV
jgi:hypothetical protein